MRFFILTFILSLFIYTTAVYAAEDATHKSRIHAQAVSDQLLDIMGIDPTSSEGKYDRHYNRFKIGIDKCYNKGKYKKYYNCVYNASHALWYNHRIENDSAGKDDYQELEKFVEYAQYSCPDDLEYAKLFQFCIEYALEYERTVRFFTKCTKEDLPVLKKMVEDLENYDDTVDQAMQEIKDQYTDFEIAQN